MVTAQHAVAYLFKVATAGWTARCKHLTTRESRGFGLWPTRDSMDLFCPHSWLFGVQHSKTVKMLKASQYITCVTMFDILKHSSPNFQFLKIRRMSKKMYQIGLHCFLPLFYSGGHKSILAIFVLLIYF